LKGPDVRGVPVFIYGLVDPRHGVIRYVGKSANPDNRLHSHRHLTGTPRVRDWVKQLSAQGHAPGLSILHEVAIGDDAAQYERYFIGLLSRVGDLLNRHGVERARKSAQPKLYGSRLRHCRFCRSTQHEGPRCPTQKAAA
jgi:hypothetical protein